MQHLTLRGLAVLVSLALSVGSAMAQTVEESVIAQLREQGFTEFTLSRTWLGRVQILALSDTLRREIVLNPQTGEILRDYWSDRDSGRARAPLITNPLDDDDPATGPGDSGGRDVDDGDSDGDSDGPDDDRDDDGDGPDDDDRDDRDDDGDDDRDDRDGDGDDEDKDD